MFLPGGRILTTAANELLASQANVGEVLGPDTQRVGSLYSHSLYAPRHS